MIEEYKRTTGRHTSEIRRVENEYKEMNNKLRIDADEWRSKAEHVTRETRSRGDEVAILERNCASLRERVRFYLQVSLYRSGSVLRALLRVFSMCELLTVVLCVCVMGV